MFRCEECKQVSKPREGCNRVIVETRPKVYFILENGDPIEVGRGQETVRERNLCGTCFAIYKSSKGDPKAPERKPS